MSVFERGRVIAGRYRLDRILAQGGMGSVWVAHHLQLDVDVAVKLLAPEFAASADARARFEREAKASAQLRIANAVQVYDFGIEDNTPFIVMELLEGEDLQTHLTRMGRLTPGATLAILNDVCRGLRRAHEVGLVHRDLKPANIFISRQGRDEVTKILDFGIAKASEPAMGAGSTRPGTILGTPHFMSPEQVRSTSKVDLRADLWALGVIAFRCVTGELPFPGEAMGEVLIDVCTKPIPIASHIAPDLPPELDKFFERALMRDPEQRFQTADDLADAFADAQEPVTMLARAAAKAPSAPSRPDPPAAEVPAVSTAPEISTAPPLATAPTLSAAADLAIAPTVSASRPISTPPPISTVPPRSTGELSSSPAISQVPLSMMGTLAPASQTQSVDPLDQEETEAGRPRAGIILACAGMLALGAAGAFLLFSGGHATGSAGNPGRSSAEPQATNTAPVVMSAAAPATNAPAPSTSASAALSAQTRAPKAPGKLPEHP